MGAVWEARHATLGTKVAIKFVEVEHAKNEEARARFQNEARAAATIQSKHAIKVYDHGLLDDGRPYIVMELLVGEPLDRRLAHVGRLSLADTAKVLLQVARALQQAHDAGITHRDLKPENIFLVRSPEEDEETAKVLDFGIAKMTDPAHALAVSSSTKTGILMGTPFYMSPEQARGLKTVDTRSDLWALGVIAFRCATGVLPFQGEALGDLLVRICAFPIPAPSASAPDLPPEFDAWMARALQREPEDRFQSATEMAEALALTAGLTMRVPASRSLGGSSSSSSLLLASSPRVGSAGSGAGAAPVVTSSPLTRSSRPPSLASVAGAGVSALAVSVVAAIGLVCAAAVTLFVIYRTPTTGVTVRPGSRGAAAAHAAPVVSSVATAAPAQTVPASGAPEASAGTAPTSAPSAEPAASATARPARKPTSAPARSASPGAPAASTAPAAKRPPATATAPASTPTATPTLPASDPGY